MERFINILIIDCQTKYINGLKAILSGSGNNLVISKNFEEALQILENRYIGIALICMEEIESDQLKFLKEISEKTKSSITYKIVISKNTSNASKLVKGLKEGAMDYITYPFNPNLVKAKIEIFKSLYFKDVRINQLLRTIFPDKVLDELNTYGKFSPKRIENGTVLFTDFVNFSKSSKILEPLNLLRNLEKYFKKFDEIVGRYKLEKIKTIGDAYMALAGVNETNEKPEVRACLAAIEMRDFVIKEFENKENELPWQIRIGIHTGPLVAGIIGDKNIRFDVWGDTVNIAARTENNTLPNTVSISQKVAQKVHDYFVLEHRGPIMVKNGELIEMYFLQSIRSEYQMFDKSNTPNRKLRELTNLSPVDFKNFRTKIYEKLNLELPKTLYYHNIKHTQNIEKAAVRIAKLEGVKGEDLMLLKTAVILHDLGFIYAYEDNEKYAIQFAKDHLPFYGYNRSQISIICNIISATRAGRKPKSLLEEIMVDADHDYLGRADYFNVAKLLRKELELNNQSKEELEWIEFQLNYLENCHQYYTETAKNIRDKGKTLRIHELKQMRDELIKVN